jgi:hypothetical protein
MSISKQNKLLPLIALMFIIGAMFFCGTAKAYAADSPAGEPTPTATAETPADGLTLIVKEVWLTGDTLHISVTDLNTGVDQTLELNLPAYANPGDEYVTVQATDSDGRASNSIQFKNPYYTPQAETTSDGGSDEATADKTEQSQTAVSEGNPFTPDGTGDVVDNVTNKDGKEFFSITTADGNVFYLIVDRERESDNVYLLNAVNEDDLASLAKPGDGKPVSAVTVPEVTPTATPADTTPAPEAAPDKNGDSNTGIIAFIVIAVVIIGGVAYYFKVVRPKKYSTAADSYDEPEETFDGDDELDIDGDDGEEDETE